MSGRACPRFLRQVSPRDALYRCGISTREDEISGLITFGAGMCAINVDEFIRSGG